MWEPVEVVLAWEGGCELWEDHHHRSSHGRSDILHCEARLGFAAIPESNLLRRTFIFWCTPRSRRGLLAATLRR